MCDGQRGNVQTQDLQTLDEGLCLAIGNLRKMNHDCGVLPFLLLRCSVVFVVDG